MELIQKLKNRYRGYKEKRFLETHGCKTWREYERRYDPDVGYLARCAHTFYHGYPHIYHVTDYSISWKMATMSFSKIDDMVMWCEQNCRGKWRNDWHRGFWDHNGNYEFNGIGGSDIMFFAFKEESDYIWFTLKWQ